MGHRPRGLDAWKNQIGQWVRISTVPLVFIGTWLLLSTRGFMGVASEKGRDDMSTATPTQPTNRLIDSTSPYLLQHAHNPVQWYPWGPEALARSIREDKPIFLSIGYAACHWCHVMERESFENKKIAAILNTYFIPIKVDREERPDLDEIYMAATMALNHGQGGWPMSVFLTPEQKPFYAGTYFPPTRRLGRPGFEELLLAIVREWREDREKVTRSAEALSQAVRQITQPAVDPGTVGPDLLREAVQTLSGAFDEQYGGILSGGGNKFPPAMTLMLMLREYHRSRQAGRADVALLEKVELTLDQMARGGIYDHLAGGIARYSTDPQWRVPHFEKMLYDQALVAAAYLEAYEVTARSDYAEIAREILDYVLADLRSPEGGFYSSRDADSEGVEGSYYVWTRDEIISQLGQESGDILCRYYNVTGEGNWESHNILYVTRSPKELALDLGMPAKTLESLLGTGRARLKEARGKRIVPRLDDKILTAWNGLMISTLARAGRVLDEAAYVGAAEEAARFILSRMSVEGRLLRTYREGTAHTNAFLDDYAFFVEGLLDLYEVRFNPVWLEKAIRLNARMIELFWDEAGGGFFFTADNTEPLLVRSKDFRDAAIPSGNAVALSNLLRLALILDRADLREKADRLIATIAEPLARVPYGMERSLGAIGFAQGDPIEIVIVGERDKAGTEALVEVVRQTYLPHRIVLLVDPDARDIESWQQRIPLLERKFLVAGKPAAFVCQNQTCDPPITEPDGLRKRLLAGSGSGC